MGSVTASGDQVTIKLKQPDGAFLNKVAGLLFIVPKDYTTRLGTADAFAAAPMGSGPYRVKEFRIGQYLELERFDGYWGKQIGEQPGIKRLTLKGTRSGQSGQCPAQRRDRPGDRRSTARCCWAQG
jgi:ABC-type transport system substrate-binding protein